MNAEATPRAWAELGVHLIPIPRGRKAPIIDGWPALAIGDPDKAEAHWERNPRDNMGAVLGPSKLVSFDVDAPEHARRTLAACGFDIDAILEHGVAIEGNPQKAKRLYRAPEGDPLPVYKLSWPPDPASEPDANGKRKRVMVLELRAGGGVQDVLPPSIHPDTKRPYRLIEGRDPWALGGFPEMPEELLRLWREWPTIEAKLRAACPWAPVADEDESELRDFARGSRGAGDSSSWDGVRREVLSRFSLRDALHRAGVKIGAGKFSCPIHPPDNHPSAWTWTAPEGVELLLCAHGASGAGVQTKAGNMMMDAIGLEAWRRGISPGKATAELAKELGVQLPPPDDRVPFGADARDQRKSKAGDAVKIVDPNAPLLIARGFMKDRTVEGGRTIVYHQGEFLRWTGAHYRGCETVEIERDLYGHLERCAVLTKEKEAVAYNPNRRKVGDVEHALRSVCALTQAADPVWIDGTAPVPADEVVSCANGLLHLPTRRLIPHTPRFFTRASVPFAFDAKAPAPGEWLSFLAGLWPDDPEAVTTLQEIAGYLLTADTSQQKAFLLVGPKRSGKGTIGRILTALLGKENVAAPTLTSLSANFGLAPLIGRRMALIADARLGNRADQAVIAERLLSLTGEDTQTIDRKHRDQWTGYLPTRFVILTNELPRIADASGALSSRFIILTMDRSFYGKEDTGLSARLLPELPGILGWALDGLDRLRARGHFVQPRSSEEAVEALSDLGSPVSAFLREECEVAHDRLTPCEDLYVAWRAWCERQGRHAGSAATFGRDLGAVVLGLRKIRPRDGGARVWTYKGVGLGRREG